MCKGLVHKNSRKKHERECNVFPLHILAFVLQLIMVDPVLSIVIPQLGVMVIIPVLKVVADVQMVICLLYNKLSGNPFGTDVQEWIMWCMIL
jgi:hypothetical protein